MRNAYYVVFICACVVTSTSTLLADEIEVQPLSRQFASEYQLDPAFYKKFSKLIDETIEAYRQGRISEIEYLKRVNEAKEQMRQGHGDDRPAKLKRYKHAPAYYGLLQEPMAQYAVKQPEIDMAQLVADVAIRMEEIIESKKVRDWVRNPDVQNQIKAAIEEHLFSVKGRYDIPLTLADIDQISRSLVELAKQRDHL